MQLYLASHLRVADASSTDALGWCKPDVFVVVEFLRVQIRAGMLIDKHANHLGL